MKKTILKKLESMGAAIAFAEAGEFHTACDILDEIETKFPGNQRKIVLVANDAPVKTGMIEYALSLASRLHSDTVFLNIFSRKQPVGTMRKCTATLHRLWKKCLQNNNPGGHHEYFVLRGDTRQVIAETCRRLGGVEMVIVQKQRNEPCDYKLSVPVFCFE